MSTQQLSDVGPGPHRTLEVVNKRQQLQASCVIKREKYMKSLRSCVKILQSPEGKQWLSDAGLYWQYYSDVQAAIRDAAARESGVQCNPKMVHATVKHMDATTVCDAVSRQCAPVTGQAQMSVDATQPLVLYLKRMLQIVETAKQTQGVSHAQYEQLVQLKEAGSEFTAWPASTRWWLRCLSSRRSRRG